jgi:hypothetical protein
MIIEPVLLGGGVIRVKKCGGCAFLKWLDAMPTPERIAARRAAQA